MSFSSSTGGQLIFVDTNDMSIMSKQEHPDLSEVEWDPTGRYVTSYVHLYNAKVCSLNFTLVFLNFHFFLFIIARSFI